MTKPFRSKLKLKYSPELGMWCVLGESLTRRDLHGANFYDKKFAATFKRDLDNEDFHFYHSKKVQE